MRVIAIDPGPHTGVAWLNPDKSYYTTTLETDDTAIAIWDLIKPDLTAIVIERFTTSHKISGYGLDTVEIVGGVRALAHYHKIPFFIHSPQNRYPWQDAAKLVARTMDKHCTIHAIEALAHLFSYEYQQLGVDHR